MSDATILIAHRDPATLEELREVLTSWRYHVLAPAQNASVALTLAAQTSVDFAIVGEQLAGRRDGRTLAAALERAWGVPSLILQEPEQA